MGPSIWDGELQNCGHASCGISVDLCTQGFLRDFWGYFPGQLSFRFVGWAMEENILRWLLSFAETTVRTTLKKGFGCCCPAGWHPFPAEDKLSRLYQLVPDGYHHPVNAESGQEPPWSCSPPFPTVSCHGAYDGKWLQMTHLNMAFQI